MDRRSPGVRGVSEILKGTRAVSGAPQSGVCPKTTRRGALVPRVVFRSCAGGRDLRLQRSEEAAPHLAVVAELVLVIVHLGPGLEGGFHLRVELARRQPAIEPEGREPGLNLPDRVGLQEDDIVRVFPSQQGHVVHVENPDEFLDATWVIIYSNVDPPVVEAAVAAPLADDEECRALLAALVAARSLAGAQCGEESYR